MAFDIYKRGQGKYTRLGTAAGVMVIVAIGCYSLYRLLDSLDAGNLWVQVMTPAALFVILGLIVLKVMNNRTLSDFMISSEGEMKKVNWPSRKEVTTSTIIVIGVVVFFSLLLGAADLVFQLFFSKIIG